MAKTKKKIVVLAIHGMGKQKKSFYNKVKKKLPIHLQNQEISIHGLLYADVAQRNQNALWCETRKLVRLRPLRSFLIKYVGDPLTFGHRVNYSDNYKQIRGKLEEKINLCMNELAEGDKLVVLAQSFGGFVFTDFLYDLIAESITNRVGGFIAALDLIITTGCNVPLFLSGIDQCKLKTIFDVTPKSGGPNPLARVRWVNIYAPGDVLGFPIQPVGGRYEDRVCDRRARFGFPILNHLHYWDRRKPLEMIAGEIEKL